MIIYFPLEGLFSFVQRYTPPSRAVTSQFINASIHQFINVFHSPFLWRCFPAAEDAERWGSLGAMSQF